MCENGRREPSGLALHRREGASVKVEVEVTVKYSYYRKYLNDQEHAGVAVKEGATVKDLVESLGVPNYYLHHITINGLAKELNTVLSHGDRVIIWPPMIGGG